MKRRKLLNVEEEPTTGGAYFASPQKSIDFISSGCAVLDMVLGGGYPVGRMCNIIGDKSTGKTLLAIEACANFIKKYPESTIRYVESEAAFDEEYAQALGMPIENIQFPEDVVTVEDWYNDLVSTLAGLGKDEPCLYILDSLDALSDDTEQKRKIEDIDFPRKPKQIGALFRRLVRQMKQKKMLLIIISQVRDNIGVTFGERHTRTGGRAMDFYASQCLWLAHKGMIKQTRRGIERVTGVTIKAKCKKNKVGLPHRDCEFDIRFGYGVDDLSANLFWLQTTKTLDEVDLPKDMTQTKLKDHIKKIDDKEHRKLRRKSDRAVRKVWPDIETEFLPTRKKY